MARRRHAGGTPEACRTRAGGARRHAGHEGERPEETVATEPAAVSWPETPVEEDLASVESHEPLDPIMFLSGMACHTSLQKSPLL